MLAIGDNLAQCFSALRAHKLRASLTMLGLTMGVATLITVMTIVQGANVYVEQKIANLGTNVFQIARTPFAVTDFNIIIKALKYKKIEFDDMRAVAEGCPACEEVGATASGTVRARYGNNEVTDVNFYGQTASMADIDTRTVEFGRYFTPSEAEHRANVCLIGDTLVQRLFLGVDPIGRMIRAGNDEFMVVGIMEKIGSVLGQDQDNFVIVPLPVFLRVQGAHTSLTINVKTAEGNFEKAQDQSDLVLRARRHLRGHRRHRHHERHAGERDAAAKGDRRAARRGRDTGRHSAAIHGGKFHAMHCRRACGHLDGILGRAGSPDVYALPSVGADVGSHPGSSPEFRGRVVFRDLSRDARITTGPGCGPEV